MNRIALSAPILPAFVIIAGQAYAQEVDYSVSPSVVRLQSYNTNHLQGAIRIFNNTQQPLTLSYALMPVTQSTGDGYLEPTKADDKYLALFRHIQTQVNGKPVSTIQIQGAESKAISISIDLPNELKTQDYYFAVVFSPAATTINDASTSNIHTSLGTTFLISHSSVTKPVTISSFSTTPFYTQGPASFRLEVHNPDSTIDTIHGVLSIYSLFGQKVASIPLDTVSITQGNNRQLTSQGKTIVWPEKWLWGSYTARAEVVSSNGKTTTQTIRFTAFPIVALIVITAVALIIVGITVKTLKKI